MSEVFGSVTALELIYTQSPESMRSVCMALNLLTTAGGSWLVAALLPIVNSSDEPWVTHNADDGHLDKFFYLLAGTSSKP
jgi:peptide/histidine transporter 3/4